jgi:hypothetical protein
MELVRQFIFPKQDSSGTAFSDNTFSISIFPEHITESVSNFYLLRVCDCIYIAISVLFKDSYAYEIITSF